MKEGYSELSGVICELHRRKNAVYGSAWKKRGEVIGILANVARKIDRLENVFGKELSDDGETLLNTAVDLLIYCLKFQTYLADEDQELAECLFGPQSELEPPYSDGIAALEKLVGLLGLDTWDEICPSSDHLVVVLAAFTSLERCYDLEGLGSTSPLKQRFECLCQLSAAVTGLTLAFVRERPNDYQAFVRQMWTDNS